jgi:predicted RNA-binding protein with RPS1 domain
MRDKPYAVFLSFNSEDREEVEQIAAYLVDHAELRPWIDQWELIPGEPWVRNLERGLAASATCAIFVGKSGEGPWQKREVETALRQQVTNADFRVIPVLLPDAPRQPGLPIFLSGSMWVDFRGNRLDDDAALWRLECGIRGVSPGRGRIANKQITYNQTPSSLERYSDNKKLREKAYAVFLSFNSEDRNEVESIAVYLKDRADLPPWFDPWELIPGESWVCSLERGLADSETCAVFVGQSGDGPWQKKEVEIALRKRVNYEDFRVIPVLLPKAPKQPELPLFLSGNMWVDLRKGLNDDDALWRLECGIRGIAPGRGRSEKGFKEIQWSLKNKQEEETSGSSVGRLNGEVNAGIPLRRSVRLLTRRKDDLEKIKKYAEGDIVEGTIQNVVPALGIFVDLEPGVTGLIYKKSLDTNFKKVFRKGQRIQVKIQRKQLNGKIDLRITGQSKIKEYEDSGMIKLAIGDPSFRDYKLLAQAIIHRMTVPKAKPIKSSHFIQGTLWEISVPPIGLQLREGKKVLLFLRPGEVTPDLYRRLAEVATEKDANFIIVIDILDIRNRPEVSGHHVIWFRPKPLIEMIEISQEELLGWLGRFVATQMDITPLLPYKTRGTTRLFYGREYELKRLTSGDWHGGIIIGAHQSGKTSLLHKLGERLKHRDREVIGPLTLSSGDFDSFFEHTLEPLEIIPAEDCTPDTWGAALRNYAKKGKCPVFLLDEVDDVIAQDAATQFTLGKQMRSLQMNGKCEFYLAGHSKLREAILLEEGPFRNFAEEITLTGLSAEAALQLILEPITSIGFKIIEPQARQIFLGTAGVPYLIQEFCIRLITGMKDYTRVEIDDAAISAVADSPEYLHVVFNYYEYAQTWDSVTVMTIVALLKQANRQQIIQELNKFGVTLNHARLEKILDFLVQFGILTQSKQGYYRILSQYLADAITLRDPHLLLEAEIAKGKEQRNS